MSPVRSVTHVSGRSKSLASAVNPVPVPFCSKNFADAPGLPQTDVAVKAGSTTILIVRDRDFTTSMTQTMLGRYGNILDS